MKIHLPLALRGLLLGALFSAPAFAVSNTDVPEISYFNPVFEQTVDRDLNFTEYGKYPKPGYSVQELTRISLSSASLNLSASAVDKGVYSISFTPAYYYNELANRAFKLESSSLEMGYLKNVSFSQHQTHIGGTTNGGAIYTSASSLNFHDIETLLFENNAVFSYGGAIALEDSSLFMKENATIIFRNNGLQGLDGVQKGYGGGALSISSTFSQTPSRVIIENNGEILFDHNANTVNGGAISLTCNDRSQTSHLGFIGNDRVVFSGNTAGSTGKDGALGGAIYIKYGNLVFERNAFLSFQDNADKSEGGAISVNVGNVKITGNTTVLFENNRTEGNQGGALYFGVTYDSQIADNGSATFRGNHLVEKDYAGNITGAVLNGIEAQSWIVLCTKATDADSKIMFFDPVRFNCGSATDITLNSYTPSGASEAVTGTGRIVFSGEYAREDLTRIFEDNGLEASGEAFDACLAESMTSMLGGEVTLAGGSLEVREKASVQMSQFTAKQGSKTYLSDGGSLLVDKTAVFEAGSTFGTSFKTTGAPCVLNATSLSMTGSTLDCASFEAASGQLLTINANTTLTDCNLVFRASQKDDGTSLFGDGIRIEGTLSVQGDTRVIFARVSENDFQVPTVTTTLFVLNADAFSGNLDSWELLTSKYDSSSQEDVYQSIDTGVLRARDNSDGTQVIEFVLNDEPPSPPAPDEIVVSTGEEKAISDLSTKVRIEGGTLDATGVDASTPLVNSVIKGTDGTLLMTQTQTLVLKGQDTVGYDIRGNEGNMAGSVNIGVEGGVLGQSSIVLEGETYDISALNVLSGIVTVGEGATLGKLDATAVKLGSSPQSGTTTASLINEGTVLAETIEVTANAALTNKGALQAGSISVGKNAALGNDGELDAESLLVQNGGSLRNNGTLNGDVTLEGAMVNNGNAVNSIQVRKGGKLSGGGTFGSVTLESGAYLMAGNSPGAPVYANLTLADGATMAFAVDGTTPATASSSGSGTHSYATVTDTLTLNGSPTIEVNVGSGIVAAGSETFTLTLLQAANVAGTGSIDPLALTLTGATQLLEEGSSLAWDAATGTLTFTGTVNVSAAAQLSSADAARLADTLWSSTASLVSFARTALSQAHPGTGNGRFWAAGLGNFTSMSADGALAGFSYDGGGYAVGGDVAVSEKAVLGAAIGQTFGTHKSDDGLLSDKQRSLMFALYGNYREKLKKGGSFDLSGYAAYGSINNRANTHVGGSFATPGRAEWDDDAFAFGLLAHLNIETSETVTVSPFTGITYVHGSQGSALETFGGNSRRFDDGSMQVWSIPAGMTVKSVCTLGGGQALLPELTVAYVGDLARQNPRVRTQGNGTSLSGKGHAPGRSAIMTRAGLGWKISDTWAAGAYYTLEARSGQTNQSVNVNVSYSF